jgi:hypothetical protein
MTRTLFAILLSLFIFETPSAYANTSNVINLSCPQPPSKYIQGYIDFKLSIDLKNNKIKQYERRADVGRYEAEFEMEIDKIIGNKIYYYYVKKIINEDNSLKYGGYATNLKWVDVEKLKYGTDKVFYANNYKQDKVFKDHPLGSYAADVATTTYDCYKVFTKEEQTQNLKNECVSLGFKIRTEGNGNCVLKLMELEKTANKTDVNSTAGNVVIQNSTNTNNDAVVEQMKRANEIEKNKVLLDISDKLLTRPQSSARNCTTTVVGKLFNTRCN